VTQEALLKAFAQKPSNDKKVNSKRASQRRDPPPQLFTEDDYVGVVVGPKKTEKNQATNIESLSTLENEDALATQPISLNEMKEGHEENLISA
jgi:hypothetical protein